MTSDRRVQCSRVGLEIRIYDTPAGGIRASQSTFYSLYVVVCHYVCHITKVHSFLVVKLSFFPIHSLDFRLSELARLNILTILSLYYSVSKN